MTEDPQSPTPPTTAQVAFVELRDKQRSLAQQLASLRAQLRAIEQAQKALEPHAKGDLIRLEFTTNHTVFLASVSLPGTWHRDLRPYQSTRQRVDQGDV